MGNEIAVQKTEIIVGHEFAICTDPYEGGPRYARMRLTKVKETEDKNYFEIEAIWFAGRGGGPGMEIKGKVPITATLSTIEDCLVIEKEN